MEVVEVQESIFIIFFIIFFYYKIHGDLEFLPYIFFILDNFSVRSLPTFKIFSEYVILNGKEFLENLDLLLTQVMLSLFSHQMLKDTEVQELMIWLILVYQSPVPHWLRYIGTQSTQKRLLLLPSPNFTSEERFLQLISSTARRSIMQIMRAHVI